MSALLLTPAGRVMHVVLLSWLLAILGVVALLKLTNVISYGLLKSRIVERRKWDLNICCGVTDGGGVNVDIVRHREVSDFVQIGDVYALPFRDGAFDTVLCSHTIEHVEDPQAFFNELKRVGREVVLVLPPLWDLSAAFNLLEHRSLFLTLRKEHRSLPRHIPLPLARSIQRLLGQRIHA